MRNSCSKIAGSSTGDSGDAKLNWDEAENQAYLNWASNGRTRSGVAYTGVLAQLEKAISAGANPTSIDAVSGATYSSQAILQAYYAALKKSAAAGGATVKEPEIPASEPDPEGPDSGESNPDNPIDPADPSGDPGDDPDDVPGDDSAEGTLVDGTYSGYAFCEDGDNPSEWGAYYIFVTIEVENGKVARIADIYADDKGEVDPQYVYDAKENAVYLNKAINDKSSRTKGMKSKIQAKIDAGTDTSDISTVSGATWSSKAILQAYANAVENAKAAS